MFSILVLRNKLSNSKHTYSYVAITTEAKAFVSV